MLNLSFLIITLCPTHNGIRQVSPSSLVVFVSSLALPAFLASAASRLLLCYRTRYLVVSSRCQTVWQSHWSSWSCPHRPDGVKTVNMWQSWYPGWVYCSRRDSNITVPTSMSPRSTRDTVATGFWRCQSLRVVYSLTTMLSASPWH